MRKARQRARGSILIVAIGVLAILTALVLTLARSMRVESITSANFAASVQADSIELAGEQYAEALLVDQADQVLTLDESNFEGIPVGNAGYFWIIRPNYDDPTMPTFGLIDESAKLNINSASEDALMMLPGMTQDLADAIIDWRDADEDVNGLGAESSYYLSLPNPYQAKNAPFESVEELLLVKGFTREFLYGNEMASGHFIPYGDSSGLGIGMGLSGPGSADVDPTQYRGIFDYLTVYSVGTGTTASGGGGGTSPPSSGGGSRSQVAGGSGQSGVPSGGIPNGGATTTSNVGKININTAPREVLLTLPGLTDSDVDSILSQRPSASASDPTDTTWAQTVLSGKTEAQQLITGQAYQYSADIVAVSANGRSFKRVRVVIDIRNTTPRIIYRRDLTEFGWPLDPEILASLKRGTGIPGGAGSVDPNRRSM